MPTFDWDRNLLTCVSLWIPVEVAARRYLWLDPVEERGLEEVRRCLVISSKKRDPAGKCRRVR